MKSGWIWLPKWSQEKETQETFVFFRKNMELLEVPESFRIRISADSRYKLYINGQFCEAGPSKGNDRLWFYDEVETAPYLKKGSNDWMVVVLHYTVSAKPGNHSIFRTATPGLYLESCQKDEAGQPVFCTDESWKAKELSDIQIVSENPFFAPLQIYEAVTATEGNWTWRRKDTEAEKDCGELENGWMNAWECEAEALTEVLRREKLAERTIPFLKKIPRKFKGISKVLTSQFEKKQWEGFLAGENALEIPAHSQVCVDVDAGELMTGYLFLKMMGGQGAKITLLQSESYVMSASEKPDGYGDLPIKKDRADAEHGFLTGYVDTYQVCGEGTGGRPEIYEPFWFRTFRYIQIKITTGEEPLTLQEFT